MRRLRGGGAGELRRVLRLASDTGFWHAIGFGLMPIVALAALEGRGDTVARLHAVVEACSTSDVAGPHRRRPAERGADQLTR